MYYVAALLLKHLPLVSRMESPGKEERNRIIFTTMLAILSGGAEGYGANSLLFLLTYGS